MMGVDVYVYLGVGMMIEHGELERDTGRLECGHEPGAAGKYCPECGQPLDDTVKEPVEGYDEDVATYREFEVRAMGGYEDGMVFVGRIFKDYACGIRHPFGINGMCGECARLAGGDETGLDQQMADVRKALAGAPFYDDAKFGLWLLTYCSY